MEEIIGLLIVLAVGIFQGVSKKLEKSGKQKGPGSPTGPVTPSPTQTGSDDSPFDVRKWIAEAVKEAEAEMGMTREPEEDLSASVEDAVAYAEVENQAPVRPAEQVMPVAPVKPVVASPSTMEMEKEKTNKEKIDPKKLIIYSEIMTPKCMNNN